MLKPDHGPLETHAFLIAVELEKGVADDEKVRERLHGSVGWMDGVGQVEAESLGIVETYPEPEPIVQTE